MATTTTVHLKSGTSVNHPGDMWKKEWPNALVIFHPSKKDQSGNSLVIGYYPGDWDGFSVNYDD